MKDTIGIFDSGLGGLSIWQEIVSILPCESTLYFADSANCPYGQKSQDEIVDLSESITRFLAEKGAKIVVVACNTATTAAVAHLRSVFSFPIVGVEPAVKPAALSSRSGKIGLLATQGTIESPFYNSTRERYASDVEVIARPGFGLVEAVENNSIYSVETEALLRRYIEPMMEAGVDKLVLGCTHYPFLIPVIKKIVGDKIDILDPAPAVARQCQHVLKETGLFTRENSASYEFVSSGDSKKLDIFLRNITSLPFNIGKYE